ncbi:MAG: hypothetical protein JJ992_04835 [Planctomycetes bacterium]|nr:hypothetical protein [Planctomycetota bacterium]
MNKRDLSERDICTKFFAPAVQQAGWDSITQVREDVYFTAYRAQARAVLNALLDKYTEEGIVPIKDVNIVRVQPLDQFGMPVEIVNLFGGREQYLKAIRDLEAVLYESAA